MQERPASSYDYRRIESAIRYLEDHHDQQPSLDEVAEHVGLSKYHFQRTFRRWAGVSPKRFLQYLTVEHAKDLLDGSASVLETAFETGLSGPGRLHDLFVSTEAVTPGNYKRRGEGLTVRYGVHESPFGDCVLATTERGLCNLRFVDQPEGDLAAELEASWPAARIEHDSEGTAELVEQIFERSDGAPGMSLFLAGTNFQIKVWKALLRIPEDRAVSYGDVARAIDNPGAVRAVGGAVGDNPIAYLIPCHRVLRANARLGGYRWGTTRKLAILGWEAGMRERAGQPTAAVRAQQLSFGVGVA